MDDYEATPSLGSLFWFVLVVTLGWSLLYALYCLVLFGTGAGVKDQEHTLCSFPGRSDGSRVVCVDVNQVFYPVSYWSDKGGRPYQEDRMDIRHGSLPRDSSSGSGSGNGSQCSSGVLPDTSLYGVYDGHGGSRASHHCQQHLLSRIIELAFHAPADEDGSRDKDAGCKDIDSCGRREQRAVTAEQVAEAIRQAFRSVDASFTALARSQGRGEGRGGTMWQDGSTAVVAIVHDGHLIVGNAGDSRCILVQRGGRVKAMSDDHKPSREDEERRIKQLGGRVMFWGSWRVEGILAMSRAIGDVPLKPFVTAEPEVLSHCLQGEDGGSSGSSDSDLFVVLASDGLFDVMSNEEVAQFITRECQRSDFKNFARNLCTEAALLGSSDNVTVQVIDVRRGARRVRRGGGAS